MLSRKTLRIFLAARLRGAKPIFLKLLVIHFLAAHFKPIGGLASFRPRLNRGPGPGAELRERVGRYRALRMRPRAQNPVHDKRDENGFADAVACGWRIVVLLQCNNVTLRGP